jgi:phosphinothricin acetyltransferase
MSEAGSETTLTVRNAVAARDGAACAAIYAPHVEASAVSFEESAPTAAEMAARIERVAATHAWLVAELGDRVVGYAYACPFQARPAYRWSVSVSVYVDAQARRGGVGGALYRELLEGLRARGFRMACAGITLPNEASVRLHEGLGFQPTGVNREIGWKDGAWRDVGWWQLELVPAGDGAPAEPAPPG